MTTPSSASGLVLLIGYRTSEYVNIHDKAFWYGARDRVYRCVADYISTHASHGDAVVADEVGTIAYYSQLPMIDLAGLITVHPRERVRVPNRKPRWYIWIPSYTGIEAYKADLALQGEPARREVFQAQSAIITPEELNRGVPRFAAVVLDEGQTGARTTPPQEAEGTLMQAGLDALALYTRRDASTAVAKFRTVLALHPEPYGATFQIARRWIAPARRTKLDHCGRRC